MKILSVHIGHNASSCLVENGVVKAAVEEERFSRVKMHHGLIHGLPEKSLEWVLKETASSKDNIDYISIPLSSTIDEIKNVCYDQFIQNFNFRWAFFFFKKWERFGPLTYAYMIYLNRKKQKNIRSLLSKFGLGNVPIKFVDHHLSHAASTYYLGNQSESLIFTADGSGDGNSGGVYKGINGKIEKLFTVPRNYSLGWLYSTVTVGLGFKESRHEGKITGLAAYGKVENTINEFRKVIDFDKECWKFKELDKQWIPVYPRRIRPQEIWDNVFSKKLTSSSKEDIAAGVQAITEEMVVKWVDYWTKKENISNVCVAGGIFANVKINQRVESLKQVKNIFVTPPMGDDGLSVGSALYVYNEMLQENGKQTEFYVIQNPYWGPKYSNDEILKELEQFDNISYELKDNIEQSIAQCISDNKIVARFNGRLEFGPRALGNRSLLYACHDPAVNKWLNEQLNRTEFMPFAPATAIEDMEKNYLDIKGKFYPSRFMTITADCTEYMRENYSAAVHIDNTARPQLVSNDTNPSFYKMLQEYKKISGYSTVINTSFNMHEEPIVCTPNDGIRSFLSGNIDYLAIGDYLVESKN